ncbi:hypothetical protein [Streptomyces sp. NPDC054975]
MIDYLQAVIAMVGLAKNTPNRPTMTVQGWSRADGGTASRPWARP